MSVSVSLLSEAEAEIQAGNLDRGYGLLVEVGRNARESHDAGNWLMGDAAECVDIAWGEERLQGWADDVGISYPKAREVRRVARQWPPQVRDRVKERYPDLSWSHFQVAAGHRDEDGEPDAEHWLAQAGANEWTVSALKERLHDTPISAEELRYLDGLEDWLQGALEGNAGEAMGAFVRAIRSRLEEQHRRRGVATMVSMARNVAAEIAEEALDVVGWSWMWRAQAAYHELPSDPEQLAELVRLGYRVWERVATAVPAEVGCGVD